MKARNSLCNFTSIRAIYPLLFTIFSLRIHNCFGASFVTTPSSKQGTEGYSTTLSCGVTGVPATNVFIAWMQDNQVISKEDKVMESFTDRFEIEVKITSLTSTYTLTIKNLIREDSTYSYQCQINENGKVISKFAKIQVQQLPGTEYPKCIPPMDNIKEGDTVEIECQSELITPLPVLEWKYKNELISSEKADTTDFISIKHSFIVTKDRVYNSTFWCFLTTPFLQVFKNNCSIGPLRVLYKPEVEISGEQTLEMNKEHVFICSSRTYPAPKRYQWSFEPELRQDQYKTETDEMVLRISKLGIENDGTAITCSVENSAGWGHMTKLINVVHGPKKTIPIIPKQPAQDHPKTDQSSSPNTYNDMTTAMILSIAGCSLLVLSLLAATLLCYFYMCVRKRYLHGSGYKIAQPDVYSEPRDNLPAPVHTMERVPPWMQRTVGIQVRADLPLEMGQIYTDVPKAIEQTKKEEFIKPASRSV